MTRVEEWESGGRMRGKKWEKEGGEKTSGGIDRKYVALSGGSSQ